jgi:cell division protein FtsL
MIYGLIGALAIFAPMTYLFIYNLKNQNRIDFLQQQINTLNSHIDKQNSKIASINDNHKANIAYDILKNNCRRMDTCHLFK